MLILQQIILLIKGVFGLQNIALAVPPNSQPQFVNDGGSGGGSTSSSSNSGWASSMLQEAEGWGTDDDGISNTAKNIVGSIISVIRVVGMGIAIIMITYVAIKYMSAAPSEKAEFKKSATALIVGAVVLFASTNILAIIADFAAKNIVAP